jgi:hypothetical protein
MKYSATTLLSQALRGQRKWPAIIAPTQLKQHYDAIIDGVGGHGLASAHYLAENHGMSDVLVLDSGCRRCLLDQYPLVLWWDDIGGISDIRLLIERSYAQPFSDYLAQLMTRWRVTTS